MLMETPERPRPYEEEIICLWTDVGGKLVGDPECNRIKLLTTNYFEKLGTDESGWATLFRDPEDSRLWERIYPLSHMHGGGPPALYCLPEEKAKEKYPQLFR
jgi:hypothetical protein